MSDYLNKMNNNHQPPWFNLLFLSFLTNTNEAPNNKSFFSLNFFIVLSVLERILCMRKDRLESCLILLMMMVMTVMMIYCDIILLFSPTSISSHIYYPSYHHSSRT